MIDWVCRNRFDTTAPLHHFDGVNRLTISLDDDLYAMARAHAVSHRLSLSKAVADLLRRRVASGPSTAVEDLQPSEPMRHPLSGFPMGDAGGYPFGSREVVLAEEEQDFGTLRAMGLDQENQQGSAEP